MKLFLWMSLVTVSLHTSQIYVNKQGVPEIGMSACTAEFVRPDTLITAAHCLENNRGHQWIKTNEGKSFAVNIVAIDFEEDIALLQTPGLKHAYCLLGAQVKPTDKVYTVNSGEDLQGTYGEGVVENIVKIDELPSPGILHNIAIFQGASGSGLFDRKGRLVGINDMKQGALSWAINTATIERFLNENHIKTK